MSALDQAFIKAYDKPTTAPPPSGGTVTTSTRPQVTAPAGHLSAPAVTDAQRRLDQVYRDGSLYRLDSTHAAPSEAESGQGIQPAGRSAKPHYSVPPPASPKRGMRRSMLRLAAGQTTANSAPSSEPLAPPRVQRKVIFRHIAHGGPATLANVAPPHYLPSDSLHAELPPESANEPSAPIQPSVAKPGIAAEPAPEVAPLNELQSFTRQVEIHCDWDAGTAAPVCILMPDAADLRLASTQALVDVQLDSLPEPAGEIWDDVAIHQPSPIVEASHPFAAKSLSDEREAHLRVDPPHARAAHRPHLPFGAPSKADAQPAQVEPNAIIAEVAIDGPMPSAETAPFAAEAAAANASLPVWEVDRFHWPRTCEKLLSDENGYLAQAGARLLAAAGDGLKTLAITGSRRGEGRTTLALCLARVAAKTGLHVALLDADFNHPALASRLGLAVTHGWQAAALGHIPLSEAAVKSLADEITVLPLETSPAVRSLSLADPRVTATLRAIAATFDLVIVDCGPLGPGERLAFPPGEGCPLDAMIVVRDLRFVSAEESQEVGERIYAAGVEAVGIAQNFVIEEAALAATA